MVGEGKTWILFSLKINTRVLNVNGFPAFIRTKDELTSYDHEGRE